MAGDPSSLLPPFIERGGEQVYRGPYQQDATDLRAFVLRGDRRRLAALCERMIDGPSGGAVRCRPVGDAVVLSFAEIHRLSSLDPRDRTHGWTTETDVIFWVPVILEHDVDGVRTRGLAWLIPYIFVDQGCAVITGREVYGFPKAHGRFEIPASPTSDEPYRVHTHLLDRFTPSSQAREQLLFELQRVGDASPDGPSLREVADLILGDAPGAALLAGLGSAVGLLRGELPVVFLRQLRDVADPTRAVYQEILVASARTTAIRTRAPIPGAFELRLRHCDSHPIAAELGLRNGAHPVVAALHVDFDFTMETGRTLFVSGPGARSSAPAPRPRQKLAVLGGGLGSLAAVFAITEQPDWQDRFDITLYQQGFRLGGKGASGRNADVADRIEEHGLHIWFGFYTNAFRMIRRCFAAAGRDADAPLADWRQAFTPHHHVVLQERIDGAWSPWTMVYPPTPGEPGDEVPASTPIEWVRRLAGATSQLLELADAITQAEPGQRTGGVLGLVERAVLAGLVGVLRSLQQLTVSAVDDPEIAALLGRSAVSRARREILAQLERSVERREDARRMWISIDLQLTMLLGIVRDGLLIKGFHVADEHDFVDWLRRHGASEMTVTAASVRVGYGLVFGFEDGDPARPRLAAGVALYGLLRMLHGYRGAIMWKMQAGMGDVVFAPLYEVLRARGVKFEFFHKVRHLGLSEDGRRIDRVVLGRQATVKGGGAYDPLVDVKRLPCWPDRPRYEQLVEGDALAAGAVDLESSWADWADVGAVELREGQDFDAVILGIPPAALRSIAGELIARKPEWRRMVDEVKTVCTHAFQLWTRPDLAGLGWRAGADTDAGPLQGAYVEPTDTWADMTHLLPVERWPAAHRPGHIAYFCGPLTSPDYPDSTDHDFPRRERERVIAMASSFLDRDVGHFWPRALDPAGRFASELLIDPSDTQGPARLRTQCFKANVEPTDRYTLSLPGSTAARLPADGSGVDNLFLTGDWIDNGFNAGCVEATVMAGMQCARAVTGAAIEIDGEPTRLRRSAPAEPGATPSRLRALAGRLLARLGGA